MPTLSDRLTSEQVAFLADVLPDQPWSEAEAQQAYAEYLADSQRNDAAAFEVEWERQQEEAVIAAGPYGCAPTIGSNLYRVYSTRTGNVYATLPPDEAVAVMNDLNGTAHAA